MGAYISKYYLSGFIGNASREISVGKTGLTGCGAIPWCGGAEARRRLPAGWPWGPVIEG